VITLRDIEENTQSFLSYMEDVDRRLREARTSIPSRPLLAFREIAMDGLTLPISSSNPHANLIDAWFKRRYGDRLLLDFNIGKAVVLIRGDPYVMRLPLVYGKWDGVVDVTKTYAGMTKELFADLPERDRSEMVTAFVWFFERFGKINNLPRLVTANIDTAILQMTSQTSHYGESQWASLQSAEKTLKEFIKRRKGSPPRTHDLTKLLLQAERLGLPGGYWPMLATIQCDPAVRYDNNVTLDQAVLAHHASIDLCAFVAEHLEDDKAKCSGSGTPVSDIVVSFRHDVVKNHNGGLLFRFVMADSRTRLLMFNAETCFALRDALKKSILSGRHVDERADLETKRDFRNVPPRHSVRIFLANEPEISATDFQQATSQVDGCHVNDFSNAIQFTFSIANGSPVQLLMDSTVVHYFVDFLEGGIEAGRDVGLFARG
jgi:hypothetical protein